MEATGGGVSWPTMKLPPDSTDHRQIEYALHLAVGRADVVSISAVDNPLARHQFGRRTTGVLKLHSFVAQKNVASLEDGRMRWATPHTSAGGMLVHIGAVSPGMLTAADDGGSVTRHTLVFCLAAVGQAWPVDAATLARCEAEPNIQPPTGYDSFVLGEAAEDTVAAERGSWRHRWIERCEEEDAPSACKPISYWLTDRSQVLPLYLVEFDIPVNPSLNAPPAEPKKCCSSGNCQYHDCACEYYCPRCQTAMCAECKLTGHHSHGPALKHVLQPLQVAYRAAVQNSQDGANPMLLSAVDNLDAARENVRARANAVRDNAAELRRNLAALVAAVNAQIDHAENCRLAALQSQEIELARQLRTLRAGEEFLRSQIGTVPMASYMQTWATHVHSRTPMLSEGAPDLHLGSEMGEFDETTGVMGYDAHCSGTPVHAVETSDGALSVSSCGSSLVSFDSPSPESDCRGSGSSGVGITTPHGATPRAVIPESCSSAVATALGNASPFPTLVLHGAVGLRVGKDPADHQDAGYSDDRSALRCERWWEPPKTASDASRAAVTAATNSQFAGTGGENAQSDVNWGWCSQPEEARSRAKERAARLRSAFRNAAMAGGGATALLGRQGRGLPKSSVLSKSAEVIVGQAVTLASGKVDTLQSIEVLPCCYESGAMSSEPAVRVKLRHADAKSGGLGIVFGRYSLPYRYPAACTTDACAVQINGVAAGSVASLRPALRVGSVLVGVNGQRVSTMRLEQVLKVLHEAEVAASREIAGEIDEASLTLDLMHEMSAPAMPLLSPQRGTDESRSEHRLKEPQIQPPRPPPPFANDVLSEVILEEQIAAAIRIQAMYRGGAQRVDHEISHLAATIMQAHVRGVRARKAVNAHRAVLLAQEEQMRQDKASAMPQLEEEHGSTGMPCDTDVQPDSEPCGSDAPSRLESSPHGLENSPKLATEGGVLDISPRTLAKQLEVGGDA